MKIIKKYRDFLYEAKGEINPDAAIILDAIQNTPQGKLLQRLLEVKPVGTGTNNDFDKIFEAVKTGRVYINGSYPGKTRIERNSSSNWCQSSVSSGKIYGVECFSKVEDVIRYSCFRYVSLKLETGIAKKEMLKWLSDNEQRVYAMKDYNEIIETFKKEMGISNMITDPSVIYSLPSYKRLEKILSFSPFLRQISFELNPLDIDAVKKSLETIYSSNTSGNIRVILSSKKEYKLKYDSRTTSTTIYIGSDNINDIDEKFLRGVISSIEKIYDSKILYRANDRGIPQNSINLAKHILISIVKAENNEEIKNYLIKISKENPMGFAEIFKRLKDIRPDIANMLSLELGDENVKDIVKGSNVLRSFGFGE